jgi:hypothetical protein
MIHFFNTVGQLKKTVDWAVETFGENTLIGSAITRNGIDYVDGDFQMDMVYIDKDGYVVGDEANDYKPKEDEYLAFRVS